MATDFSGPSKVIAIAGSKGGCGQHVTEELLSAGFKVIVLLRSEKPELVQELIPFLPSSGPSDSLVAEVVDFTNKDQLASVFKKYTVDTVISVLVLSGPDEWKVEQNLLNAAIETGAKRFSPSNFAGPVEDSQSMRAYEFKRIIAGLLKDAPISWTHFTNGLFMNYFARNAPPQAGPTPLGHLYSMTFVIDIENASAEIPGDGNAVTGFTEITDVGKGVAAACALEAPWTPETGWMTADVMSYNDVVKIAEDVRARKFSVKYISMAELEDICKKGENAPVWQTFFHEAMKSIAESTMGNENHLLEALKKEGKENLFRPISVRAFIEKWWKGVP